MLNYLILRSTCSHTYHRSIHLSISAHQTHTFPPILKVIINSAIPQNKKNPIPNHLQITFKIRPLLQFFKKSEKRKAVTAKNIVFKSQSNVFKKLIKGNITENGESMEGGGWEGASRGREGVITTHTHSPLLYCLLILIFSKFVFPIEFFNCAQLLTTTGENTTKKISTPLCPCTSPFSPFYKSAQFLPADDFKTLTALRQKFPE